MCSILSAVMTNELLYDFAHAQSQPTSLMKSHSLQDILFQRKKFIDSPAELTVAVAASVTATGSSVAAGGRKTPDQDLLRGVGGPLNEASAGCLLFILLFAQILELIDNSKIYAKCRILHSTFCIDFGAHCSFVYYFLCLRNDFSSSCP